MKLISFCPAILVIVCLFSCKKEKMVTYQNTELQQVDLARLKDSCSYTIDGKTFICDNPTGRGKGSAGVNLDTTTKTYDADSIQYRNLYEIGNSLGENATNGGHIVIRFVKKYGKNQLTRNVGFGIMGPLSDIDMYAKGEQPYAVDYERFNSQNGVVLEVLNRTPSRNEILQTYIYQSPYWPTMLTNDCQKDSKFEIINIYAHPGGGHLIEAKFTANVFDRNEKPTRLENGYLRIQGD